MAGESNLIAVSRGENRDLKRLRDTEGRHSVTILGAPGTSFTGVQDEGGRLTAGLKSWVDVEGDLSIPQRVPDPDAKVEREAIIALVHDAVASDGCADGEATRRQLDRERGLARARVLEKLDLARARVDDL